jgi:hypothetical protein
MLVIQWRKGSKFTGDAEKAYEVTERIRKRDGEVTRSAVIAEAKRKNSPIHRHFEWDNSVAAEKWRLRQAGDLINSLQVIRTEATTHPVSAYSVVTKPAKSADAPQRKVYESTEEALADPVMRDEILANAIRDAIAFRKKYHALSELSKVFSALDTFLAEASV